MNEQWTKPDFLDVSVAGECTAYAGTAERDRPAVPAPGEPIPGSVTPTAASPGTGCPAGVRAS